MTKALVTHHLPQIVTKQLFFQPGIIPVLEASSQVLAGLYANHDESEQAEEGGAAKQYARNAKMAPLGICPA